MPNISAFITPSAVPPSHKPSFKEFQDLPVLVREALVWGTKEQDAGRFCQEREVTQYMIDHYDVNQQMTIGALTNRFTRFIDDPVRCRMVRCFVDCGCNMVAAKLTWREDY